MDYLELLDSYKQEMLEKIKESISYPSVKADPVKTAEGEVLPFGRDVHDSFLHMLKLGEDMGFETFNAENYGGHIQLSAEDENAETMGISGHLDVVPVADGWKTEPFNMVEKDGFIYGRGTSDDKGPFIACLYGLKALRDAGLEPKKNVRLIIGLDEETGSEGMGKYLEIAGQPDMGFTPDSDFPLVNGEMGNMAFQLAQKLTKQIDKDALRLTKLEAGTAPNAVPGLCRVSIAGDSKMYDSIKARVEQFAMESSYDIKAKKQGSALVIEAVGVPAHGAHPDLGLNAVSIMMEFLGRIEFANEEINDFVAYYNEYIGFNLHGEKCECAFEDEKSGKLIFNVGMASINEDIASVTINIRYPVSETSDRVYEGIEKTLEGTNIGIIKMSDDHPIFMDLDSELVQKLIGAYRDETGDQDAQPFVIGGGTYAKHIANTLAFGAMFPGEPDTMHQNDENKSVDLLMKAARIYARAIHAICF